MSAEEIAQYHQQQNARKQQKKKETQSNFEYSQVEVNTDNVQEVWEEENNFNSEYYDQIDQNEDIDLLESDYVFNHCRCCCRSR